MFIFHKNQNKLAFVFARGSDTTVGFFGLRKPLFRVAETPNHPSQRIRAKSIEQKFTSTSLQLRSTPRST